MFNLFKKKKNPIFIDPTLSFMEAKIRVKKLAGNNIQLLADSLKDLAKQYYSSNPFESIEAMQESFALVMDISKLKWIGFRLNELGFIHESYRMLGLIPNSEFRSQSELNRFKQISDYVKAEILTKNVKQSKVDIDNKINEPLKKTQMVQNVLSEETINNFDEEHSLKNNTINVKSKQSILGILSNCENFNNSKVIFENLYIPKNDVKYIVKSYDKQQGLIITSSLEDENISYLNVFSISGDDIQKFQGKYIRISFNGELNISGCLCYRNARKEEIEKPKFFEKSSIKFLIPQDTENVYLKIRIKGSGIVSNLELIIEDYPFVNVDITPEDFVSNLSIPKKHVDKLKIIKEKNQLVSSFDESKFDYVTYNKILPVDKYSRKFVASVDNSIENIIYCISVIDHELKLVSFYVSNGNKDFYLPKNAKHIKVSIRIKGSVSFSPNLSLKFSETYFAKNNKKTFKIKTEKKLEEIQKSLNFQKVSLTKLFSNSDLITYTELDRVIKSVKVACIMDEFTWLSYSPEADMIQLLPDVFENQLETFRPDLIFIESAWRGIDNKWTNIIHKCPDEMLSILCWAKLNNVPTVFWNKEDPIHFETFKNLAVLFDYIFTYDFNCVQKYKEITGKNNAFFLPMAVQPLMFDPTEKYERIDGFCFAGSYYKKYVERSLDFNHYVSLLPKYKELVIYDRQFGKTDVNYKMPDEYTQYIKGNLPYEEIDRAYKGYSYAINLNSIKQANSIARRVFELLACNTVTVSNFSYGLSRGFGDLVITSDDPKVIIGKLKQLSRNPYDIDKFKLLGMRKVFSENTYCDRFKYILSKVTNFEMTTIKPKVALVAFVENIRELKVVKKIFASLSYVPKRLFVISNKSILKENTSPSLNLIVNELCGYDYVGVLESRDYYSQHYLEDLINAFCFSRTDAVYKSTCFVYESNKLELRENGKPYTQRDEIDLSRGLIKTQSFLKLISEKESSFGKFKYVLKMKSLATDVFNYCKNLQPHPNNKKLIEFVSDLQNINTGFNFRAMQNKAEELLPQRKEICNNVFKLTPEDIYKYCSDSVIGDKLKKIKLNLIDNSLLLESCMSLNEYVYVPINREFKVSELPVHDNVIYLHFETGYVSTLILRIAYFFYGEDRKKIFSKTEFTNNNLSIEIPENAFFIKFQIRIQAGGKVELGSLIFDHKEDFLPYYFDKNEILCLTNNYPSYDNLYKNAFVHTRLKLYKLQNINATVFQLNNSNNPYFSEFDSVDVIRANLVYLKQILSNNDYKVVMVHFLDKNMYEALKLLPVTTKILVWCHGADILKYTRKLFNYTTEQDLTKAKEQSSLRSAFWNEILNNIPMNFHFIFVSKYLKETVENDYSVKLPKKKYSIIHNPINTELFCYSKKNIEHRYKILSIRPFASRTYANDLTVGCILELSKRSDFDKFEITIIGDGKLFDETLEPLRKFKNVHLLKKFLTQTEIYEYHKQNGIFLVPSREDTQGVSRDEAMSSGLVPVTNAVAAIPEFVDDSCGVLAPAEDYVYMAKKIGEIVDNPQLFIILSTEAAKRVRAQVASELIINKEINLVFGSK